MRAHPIVIAATICAATVWAMAATAQGAADPQGSPSCSGGACTMLAVSADGCTWNNSSTRAIRFSLIAGGTALVTTVLAPGEAFKETNKAHCVSGTQGTTTYQAAFVTLRQMADDAGTTSAPKIAAPRPKPAMAAAQPVANASVTVPRQKPASPVMPRAKPEAPVQTTLAQPAAPLPPAQPAAALVQDPANPCGDACAEILFKVVDECLWVQSQNPKSITFQATIKGRMMVLALDGADGKKADGQPPAKNATAHHARQPDPFQSSSPGIPVYRARLGTCVKDRSEISHFVAVYTR